MTDMIMTSGLSKSYGGLLRVKDVDLSVPEGAVYGFLGPNGAGKSTTMKMLLGLARPTAGEITIFGKQLDGKNRLSILRGIGSLIESPSYYGHLTGWENLRILALLRGIEEKEIAPVLEAVRLTEQKNRRVSEYSLGMKQRLGLACALLGGPRLLILDEPTNGLDPAGIQEMRELVRSLPERMGMTVLVSSHLLSEIDQIADTVGIINHGELVFQDSLSSLHALSRRQLAVRTLDNDAAQRLMEEQGVVCEREEGFLLLPSVEDSLAARLAGLLSSRVGLVRLEERSKSLEDLFLEMTGTAVSL